MADEMVDVVDDAQSSVGVVSKEVAHKLGLWHYTMHCWIYGSANGGYLLFQRRSPAKVLFPGVLDISAAGHYAAGESVADSVREIAEELRIDVDFEDLLYLGMRTEVYKVGSVLNREFCRVFLYETDRRACEFTPGGVEVGGLVELNIQDGLDLFSARRETVPVVGTVFENGGWQPYTADVTVDSFGPRIDPYYYKMLILSKLAIAGFPDLAI